MGRSHPVQRLPDRPGSETSSGITGHNRAYPRISAHIRAYPRIITQSDIIGQKRLVACGITSRRASRRGWSSRAVSPVAGSRAVSPGTGSRLVACPIARCRIVCGMARRRITSRRVPARVGTLDVPAVVTVRRAERPSPAMSRPNSACRRRRYRRLTNIYSFVVPWRFMVAPSAARLRRTVGRHRTPKRSCQTVEICVGLPLL